MPYLVMHVQMGLDTRILNALLVRTRESFMKMETALVCQEFKKTTSYFVRLSRKL